MALNSLLCADVPLRNCSLTHVRDSEWQWHQLGHMQICTLSEKDNHTNIQPLSFFTGKQIEKFFL